jgi:hypothetical protein
MSLRWRPAVCTCVVAVGILGCASPRPPEPDWLVAPGEGAGRIQRASTEAMLVTAYGSDMVRRVRIELGEGETAPGTVLFPSDSPRRLEILWHDTVARARPARLVLRGAASRWQLPGGVSLGTSLRELERRNGRPFILAGFGWDYGGVILDWEGGALASRLSGVKLYLDPGPAQRGTTDYEQVLGDRDYSSSARSMQVLDPRVYQIFVDLE